METWLQLALTSVVSILASSGFWAFVQHKDVTRQATTRLLMGLAYDQLTKLGIKYLERGWITKDEFEEYQKYFFEPYHALGGNGVAARIMAEVAQLPLRSHNKYSEIFRNPTEEYTNNVRVFTRTDNPSTPSQ